MKWTSIIIPATVKTTANAAMRDVEEDPNAANCADSISVPLSPTGLNPATHYGAFGLLSDERGEGELPCLRSHVPPLPQPLGVN